jgi:hypothetical protein
MTWTRIALFAAVVVLVLAPAADAHEIHVAVPAPGHLSVQVVKFTASAKTRGLPKRLKLRPQKLRSLPPSVRVMYAQRTIRRKRNTVYELALITVNVANRAASAAQTERDDTVVLNDFWSVLIFLASPDAAVHYQRSGGTSGMTRFQGSYANNADLLTGMQAEDIADALRPVIDPNGDGKVDPGLDTGHYDDGHAFGWGIKSNADERKTWAELAKESLDQYILQLEESFKYDIDGDGQIEAPAQGGGQQIDTHVGDPVVTGG